MPRFLDVLNQPPAAPAEAPAASPAAQPGAGKLDAVMKAAGVPVPAAAAAGYAPKIEATGEALVGMVESWTPVIVRMYCTVNHREWDRELDAACRITVSERAQLKLTADSAAPYLAWLISQSEKLAAVLFVAQFGFILTSKFGLVKTKPIIREKTNVQPSVQPDTHQGAGAGTAAPAETPAPARHPDAGKPPWRKPEGQPRKR